MNTIARNGASPPRPDRSACSESDDDVGVGVVLHPREELAKLGPFLPKPLYTLFQAFLTWMTGKAYSGQQPLFAANRYWHLFCALISLFGGVLGSAIVLNGSPLFLPLLLCSWVFTVGGARMLQTTINHQCVHKQVFGKMHDRWLSEILSTLLMTSDYETYSGDHLTPHHGLKTFANFEDDPDAKSLRENGLRSGMPKEWYWKWLWQTMFSPKFHGQFLASRLAGNFSSKKMYRQWMSVLFYLATIVGVSLTHTWWLFLVAWFFPLTFLYQVSACLQVASEHLWGHEKDNKHIPNELKSHGRYCGECPPFGQSMFAWSKFWLRMLFSHLPVRIAILPGELPEHCWHHYHTDTRNWENGVYEVQKLEETQDITFVEVWGLDKALDRVFSHLEKFPPRS
ncbi:fatty acid desaturase [Oscillatoriales cyanobacterium LEGE 11467]|uniref:Fatty acid desaturase n=1 Tax=Zarconia navalis LEGE 11467 TaxID=1828826 RepID=A0A928Z7G8_9CYAN|nr:fatty acid desaturase [Zarconia navalis]MBE9039399.1 fatty acid desaturase [Zarconia navalis LEGE 11467]